MTDIKSMDTATLDKAKKEAVFMTYTGRMINVFDPQPDDISIADIAHALSNICRYGVRTASRSPLNNSIKDSST